MTLLEPGSVVVVIGACRVRRGLVHQQRTGDSVGKVEFTAVKDRARDPFSR